MHSTTYDYYRNGWLKDINYDGSRVAEYTHDAVGLLAQIDFYHDDPVLGNIATGAYDVYSYDTSDPRDFLKTITMHYKDAVGNPASSVVDYTDGEGHPNVDKAGNQLSMGNLAGQWTYTYDHAGRIASIVPPNPVPEQGLGGDYRYNWLGQLTNPPADPNHLTYNSAGLLSTWPGMYSYTRKPNGALDQVKDTSGLQTIASLSYDSAGFLDQVVCGCCATTRCSWDADGGFLGYAETGGGSDTQSVLADPTTGSAEMDDVSGSAVPYVCDPQGDVIASAASAGGAAHYHSDADGRIQLSTGADGRMVSTYERGPNGGAIFTSDPLGSRIASKDGTSTWPPRWMDPTGSLSGLWDGYWGDVGAVFAGEASVLNPVNWYNSGKSLFEGYITAQVEGYRYKGQVLLGEFRGHCLGIGQGVSCSGSVVYGPIPARRPVPVRLVSDDLGANPRSFGRQTAELRISSLPLRHRHC